VEGVAGALALWPRLTTVAGYALIACVVSAAQLAWIDEFDREFREHRAHLFPAFLAALAAASAMAALRRVKWLEANSLVATIFLFVSVVAGFAPLLLRHPHWPVVGAGIFIAYWALIGWSGLRLGHRGVLNLAIVVIALRLVVVYVEVFGSLLSTGVGLIASGVLLIALVWAAGKLIRKLGQSK